MLHARYNAQMACARRSTTLRGPNRACGLRRVVARVSEAPREVSRAEPDNPFASLSGRFAPPTEAVAMVEAPVVDSDRIGDAARRSPEDLSSHVHMLQW